ncbi:2-oxoisovalerate dehydrogenase subunit beta [subsurface metagenome]
MREITFKEAITEAVDEEMARDPTVFIIGEDIGKWWGAALGEYQGLFDKYGPERIRETPISETAILGGAMGAAITGMRPIAFLMFCDFLGVCGDELIRRISRGKVAMLLLSP